MKLLKTALCAAALAVAPAVFAAAINLNEADVEALQRLDGIGPVKAAAIVDYRAAHGPFESKQGLTAVDGIGETTLEGIREDVTVR
ncbi:hypothetical protein KBTX_02391 [wastewater metagenome]|uniref:Helix-hairpin-helix DNA-binding motif class 1 domain-containing protein n=2 Tax=unclassified sequences TaxID=12908 RepID=A0A5B8REW6_9ZZZZ|nr:MULTISPECIES: helix-hairpin-helix domain-containing protein [Arhodomonas]MCS4505046.1 helix-hairpin-helix domain-containing protein [Arhodomonas aquaeolei]QEA06062.1 hypothetical protein KBTEX_02391 [uncultured organism]